MAFVSAAAVPVKAFSVSAKCQTFGAHARCNTVALRHSAFVGNNVMTLPFQASPWSLTNMSALPTLDTITQKEVVEAQTKWANGVVKIGSLRDNFKECEAFTDQFLNERYAFDMGKVLFKPTKCAVTQFRPTKPDAMSYFIAGEKKQYDEDSGFAVTPWTNVRFENSEFILDDGRAVAMGNYYFTDLSGGETKVEYTFGYKKINGDLKIDLHHSSLPFPSPTAAGA